MLYKGMLGVLFSVAFSFYRLTKLDENETRIGVYKWLSEPITLN